MSNPPQGKTLRYLRNLLADGENSDFRIQYITRESALVEDICVGVFYRVEVHFHHESHFDEKVRAVGGSPVDALKTALIKIGVTFR